MELFFYYDWNRLNAYSGIDAIQNRIDIVDEGALMAFAFYGVDYFNYAFKKDNSNFSSDELAFLRDFYATKGIARHKIIMSAAAGSVPDSFTYSYTKKDIIVKTKYPLHEKLAVADNPHIRHVNVTDSDISEFTRVYLGSFGAIGRDIAEVSRNFSALLRIPGNELYLLYQAAEPVGVAVLYEFHNQYFLAGGAVMPDRRNKKIHKEALRMRIAKCLEDKNLDQIISWAYKGSISLKNMNTFKMVNEQEFDVYEFTTPPTS